MFVCRRCGRVEARALAVCPTCGTWAAFRPLEEPKALSRPARFFLGPILGGLLGEVPGGTVLLLGGEPGVGKSTLALSVAGALAAQGPVVYVCGEEDPAVVQARAARLGVPQKGITFLPEVILARILQAAKGAAAVVVDSLPCLTTRASLLPGSAQAQNEATLGFVRFTRKTGCLSLLVTQVAKRGLAGPKFVEHAVDVVLVLTKDANGTRALRVTKNRLGPLPPPLPLRMTGQGLAPSEAPSPAPRAKTR